MKNISNLECLTKERNEEEILDPEIDIPLDNEVNII